MVANFPVVSLGHTWIASHYHSDYGSAEFTYRVTSVEAAGSCDIREQNSKDSRTRMHHFDATAKAVPMPMGIFDPEALQFPPFVGKKWNTEAQSRSVDGGHHTYRSW